MQVRNFLLAEGEICSQIFEITSLRRTSLGINALQNNRVISCQSSKITPRGTAFTAFLCSNSPGVGGVKECALKH